MRKRKHVFRLKPGKTIDLAAWPTRLDAAKDGADPHAVLALHVARLQEHQKRLTATARHAVLIVFQGMDASGKDGAIAHVMAGVKPQACRVTDFKQPTPTELKHDFLWRAARALPERGTFGLFNRSYYEDVLVSRVHPQLLRDSDPAAGDIDTAFWRRRFESILDFERHLHRNGTRIIKFFMHVSKEEQRARFLARLESREKQWKLDSADVAERRHWRRYMTAYEDCLQRSSSAHAPWHVVPADDKPSARLAVSTVILEVLEELGDAYRAPTAARKRELKRLRKALAG